MKKILNKNLIYPIRSKNRKKLICLGFLILLLSLIYIFDDDYSELINEIHENNLKAVQLLTGRFDYKNWDLGDLGTKPFEKCKEKRCFAFKPYWIRQKPIEQADAIMVHVPNLFYMPSKSSYKRNKKQLWSFYTMESQKRSFCSSHYNLQDLDDWFNLTQTFKPSSDLVMDYKSFESWNKIIYNLDYINSYKNFKSNKQKLNKNASALWFVSHCNTPSGRENYVNELVEFLNIDIYGNCRNFKNSKPDPCANEKNSNECYINLYNSYKFYLAFENSHCNFYITEKYWKFYKPEFIFTVNIIPIVRGATSDQYNYLSIKNSFINANDFNSAKDLANYLLYLNKNQTAYLEYFKWKQDLIKKFEVKISSNVNNDLIYKQSNDKYSPFCQICEKLYDKEYLKNKENKILKISNWFGPEKECKKEHDPNWIIEKITNFFGFCI